MEVNLCLWYVLAQMTGDAPVVGVWPLSDHCLKLCAQVGVDKVILAGFDFHPCVKLCAQDGVDKVTLAFFGFHFCTRDS